MIRVGQFILWSQPLVADGVVSVAERREKFGALTLAELDVCLGVMRGLENDAIAARRDTSVRTVAALLARAFGKLGVSSRVELVTAYGELVPPEMWCDAQTSELPASSPGDAPE